MSGSLQFTIVYADGDDDRRAAQVKEVPGAASQGRTRAEARQNVIDALRLMLSPEPHQTTGDTEALQLTLAS